MAPEERAETSRRNGALSQGPVTDEGKARSARNALKSGGCSNEPRDEGERRALAGRVEELLAQYRPGSIEAADCLKVCAGVALRRDRAAAHAAAAERATEAVARQRAADALAAHVAEEARAIRGHADGLRADPTVALAALGASAAGCDWLAGRFARLVAALDHRDRLPPALAAEAVRLLGAKPGPALVDHPSAWVARLLTLLVNGAAKPEAVARLFEPDRMSRRLRNEYDPDNLPGRDEALRRLRALFESERARWAAEADRLRPAQDSEREAVRAQALMALDRTALRRARRNERQAERDLHRAWAAFHAATARDATASGFAPGAQDGPDAAPAVAQNEPGTDTPARLNESILPTTCADSTPPPTRPLAARVADEASPTGATPRRGMSPHPGGRTASAA